MEYGKIKKIIKSVTAVKTAIGGTTAVAAIPNLTFSANITAATANGSLTQSSTTTPTEAQFNELAKELGTVINAILAALRTKGIILP